MSHELINPKKLKRYWGKPAYFCDFRAQPEGPENPGQSAPVTSAQEAESVQPADIDIDVAPQEPSQRMQSAQTELRAKDENAAAVAAEAATAAAEAAIAAKAAW